MTTQTPAAAYAASMDPQVRAQMMRAARGERRTPTGPIPMGIRYRTPAAPAQPVPVDRRPLWMTMASARVLEEIAEAAPRQRPGNITRTTRPATASSARTVSAPTPVPAAPETNPARPAPAKARAARTPAPAAATPTAAPAVAVPAPRVAEPPRPRVLGSYDAFACEACGSRYSYLVTDHGCGPLTPVTVTITTKAAGEQA